MTTHFLKPTSCFSKAHLLATPALAAAILIATPVVAQDAVEDAPAPSAIPAQTVEQPQIPAIEAAPEPIWSVEFANNLLKSIEAIDKEGLNPNDYKPKELASAISKGASLDLDAEANRAFTWLIEDMRDGRTPAKARRASYVDDPDAANMPTVSLLAKAAQTGDIDGILKSVMPMHADYKALRAELAALAPTETAKRKLIAANMDRWRWFGQDLGKDYLHTNIPEYKLRFIVNQKQISTYRTIVGKPGKTATPQLAESVEGIVYNPTWTVPQSIVKGEGLGQRVLDNPAWARSKGYTATKGANGYISVVQKPGPINSLGHVKLHMPNRHAIFLHDTPSRGLFKRPGRALSHGCIRTERAMELAMTIALVRGDIPIKTSVATQKSLKYKLLPIKRELPVYITYFTMASDVDGKMRKFRDIYGRDRAVVKAMARPRPSTPAAKLARSNSAGTKLAAAVIR